MLKRELLLNEEICTSLALTQPFQLAGTVRIYEKMLRVLVRLRDKARWAGVIDLFGGAEER